jgi:hypothetical protein
MIVKISLWIRTYKKKKKKKKKKGAIFTIMLFQLYNSCITYNILNSITYVILLFMQHPILGAKPQIRKCAYLTLQVLGEPSSRSQGTVSAVHIHLQGQQFQRNPRAPTLRLRALHLVLAHLSLQLVSTRVLQSICVTCAGL